jgi:selenocysteine lyase/cysteine desulfurase
MQDGAEGNIKERTISDAYAELESGVYAALENYSNVHRGSGHKSLVSTYLYEQARDIVLEHLGLNKETSVVIFCTPQRAAVLETRLKPGSYQSVSSEDTGLALGVRALVADRRSLPQGMPFQAGGGTTRLVASRWIIWARGPGKFEAGTPAIINIIAFARALQMIRHSGKEIFLNAEKGSFTPGDILYHDELDQYAGKELLENLRKTRIGNNILVPTTDGIKPYLDLDYAASTPAFLPVWKAACQTLRLSGGIQQEIIKEVKNICAGVLGAPPDAYDVLFTSNTTEAINLAAESLGNEVREGIKPVVLNTILEHNSNELPWRRFSRFSLVRLPVDDEGFLNMKELETTLRNYNREGRHGKKRIRLVAVSGASNVLGTFNDLEEISRIVHRYGALLLVDAAQLVAHRKVDMLATGIDYLAFSGHKVYAPFGTGALVARKGLLHFSPAESERIQSSGEENATGIAALGKALVLLQRASPDVIRDEEQDLTRRLLHGMKLIANLKIYGVTDPSSPRFARRGGVVLFGLKYFPPNMMAQKLAEQGGIGVRYGCHCAHLLIKHLLHVSPFLAHLQGLILTLFSRAKLPGLVRVSLGIGSSEEDIDRFIAVLGSIARQPLTSADRRIDTEQRGVLTTPKTVVQQQMKDYMLSVAQRVYYNIL